MQAFPPKPYENDSESSAMVRNRKAATSVFQVVCIASFVIGFASILCADEVEFTTGRKLQGKVKSIRTKVKEFDFQFQLGGKTFTRTYKFSVVRAVTMNGKRHVLTPPSASSTGSSSTGSSNSRSRTRSEIEAMIASAGATTPDWFESTQLNYPKSLDLSWPIKPPKKGWNNQRNMGQFIWDVVNPNPGRWRSGIKLVHHCMAKHQGNSELTLRDMRTLGKMYFTLLQDYPRAAFWLQKARVDASSMTGVMLAESYWRMGNKAMALEMLKRRSVHPSVIKLYGDMGDVKMAVSLGGRSTDPMTLMLVADSLRSAGQNQKAISTYESIVKSKNFRNPQYEKRYKDRARDSIAALKLQDRAVVSKVADGKFQGTAQGYNGLMTIQVEVRGGKIQLVEVTKHNEKQFYSAINDTTRQLKTLQSVQGVDATTGATITSQAIVNATAKALASGAK